MMSRAILLVSALTIGCPLALGCSTNGASLSASNPAPEEKHQEAKPNVPVAGRPVPLPATLVADRFYVRPATEDGHSLWLYTDTGGGLMLTREAADRLGLDVAPIEVDGEPTETALLPTFLYDAWIPRIEAFDGRIPVVDSKELKQLDPELDGLLGQAWFKDRVWTFDYENGQLLLRADGDLPKHEPSHRAFLGFPKNDEGKRGANYPRIEVKIDGATVDLLLDTGAMSKLKPDALAALGDGGPATRATSFISATTFDQWRQKHPDWRVIEDADATANGEPMIEVPSVTITAHTVGPVWFTRRADKNFHEWMSQWTDKRIDGALGGNALRFFRVTVDYPRALAVFEPHHGSGGSAAKTDEELAE